MDLHQYESHGRKARVMLRKSCRRCGKPLEETRTALSQFPQPRGEQQNWRQQ